MSMVQSNEDFDRGRWRWVAVALQGLLLMGLPTATARCSQPEASPSQPAAEHRAEVGRCGERGLPDCPTQAWMKANVQSFLMANDGQRLGDALDKLAKAAPTDYADWASMAQAGAQAARAGNMDGVKQSCAECHNRHRARFRGELRQRKLF